MQHIERKKNKEHKNDERNILKEKIKKKKN